ncbi:MAG: hypothetical protein MZU95_01500 [Desulfomicrobium escambiense]|nr:hypothetical protein [Desulfomicrobium escambiense]
MVINGVRLGDETIGTLENGLPRPAHGRAALVRQDERPWAIQGGPASGFIMPGLDLGGPCEQTLQNGNTGPSSTAASSIRSRSPALQLEPVHQGRYCDGRPGATRGSKMLRGPATSGRHPVPRGRGAVAGRIRALTTDRHRGGQATDPRRPAAGPPLHPLAACAS